MNTLILRTIPVAVLAAAMVGCSGGPPVDNAGLNSRNADVRRERVLQLGQNQPAGKEGRKELNNALTTMGQSDTDPLVRSASLVSLERQDKAAAQGLALQLAIDPDPIVRCDAMKVLSHGDSPRARAALLYAVRNDTSSDVRRQAVKGLGKYGDDEVVKLLIELLGDEDRGVVVASYRGLQTISGQNFGARPAQWQEWFEARGSVPPPAEVETATTKETPAVAPTPPTVAEKETPANEVPTGTPVQPPVAEKEVPATPPVVTEKPAPVETAPAPAPTPVKETPAVAPPVEKPGPSVDELKRFRR